MKLKLTILIALTILAFNSYSSSSVISRAAGVVKFGSGPITSACKHEEKDKYDNITSNEAYAFTTNNYGACPGSESPEYLAAVDFLYPTPEEQAQVKKHDPFAHSCKDVISPIDIDL